MSQRDNPQLALNNITAGVREREDANRTREAGHLDEIQGAVANTRAFISWGAVGFIDWLGFVVSHFRGRLPVVKTAVLSRIEPYTNSSESLTVFCANLRATLKDACCNILIDRVLYQ